MEEKEFSEFDPSLKKKKKKKNTSSFNPDMEMDNMEEESMEDKNDSPLVESVSNLSLADDELGDFSMMKKKKSKKSTETNSQTTVPVEEQDVGEESWKGTDRDYTYNELLCRVFRIMSQKNPEFAGERNKYVMIAPEVVREGSKKTLFSNIMEICRRMKRQPEHLISFLYAELGTQGSVDGSGNLVIKGKFQQKQIENVLRRYIIEYVTCKTCKSPDTALAKENRLFFLQCETCGSSRAVSVIKSGFRAQTEKRKLNRQ